jgi:Transposase
MKSGNVSETCRRHGIAQTLYYRWKDEAEQGTSPPKRCLCSLMGPEARRGPSPDVWNAKPDGACQHFGWKAKLETLCQDFAKIFLPQKKSFG